MSSHRWSKFWWQDYADDDALRSVSLAAQGLWMRMLCSMHKGAPYGHLTLNGAAMSPLRLAGVIGKPVDEVVVLLDELREARVFSTTSDGIMFNRRMIRDNIASEIGREAIGKRWGKKGNKNTSVAHPTRDPISPPSSLEAEAEAESESRSAHLSESGFTRAGEETAEVVDFRARQEAGFSVGRPADVVPPEVISVAFDAWNAMARRCKVTPANDFAPYRQTGIRGVLAKRGLDGWHALLAKVEASSFCNGGGDHGWVADIDFLFDAKKATRLAEGAYDDRAGKPAVTSVTSRNRLAQIARMAARVAPAKHENTIDIDQEGHMHVG